MKKLTALLLLILLLAGCTGPAPGPATDPTTDLTTTASTSGESLTVSFLDVGQADCALLECGGEYLLIDGGNVEDSAFVVSFLEQTGVQELSAVICTHAHEDHVGGLPGVLAVYPTAAVYAPTRTYSSNCFDDFMYYVDQQGLTVQIPQPGDQIRLGTAILTVLGPVKSYPDTNNTSIVVEAAFGENRFLFTGDMETDAENDMLDFWGDRDWKADVLKLGHHGSSTSTGYRFLYQVDPAYAVISVGTGNSYGHPHDEVISRLQDARIPAYRTDELGTVIAVSDGKTITFSYQTGQAPSVPEESQQERYIGNVNSRKFHLPTCTGLPEERNQILFDSYEEAIDAGYTPCSRCLP